MFVTTQLRSFSHTCICVYDLHMLDILKTVPLLLQEIKFYLVKYDVVAVCFSTPKYMGVNQSTTWDGTQDFTWGVDIVLDFSFSFVIYS